MRTVPLHGGYAQGRVALVDDTDYDWMMQYRWYVREETRNGLPHGPYVVTSSGLRMHCLIMGVTGIDHKDHDGLNNQRSNLRLATGSQNQWNRRSGSGTSKYKGVNWDKRYQKWRSVIRPGGKQRHLGYFVNEEDAARAYDAAALETYGEWACTNFPNA